MSKSIFSNISVQAQKLYKGAKNIVLEDNLLTKSFDDAVNSYGYKQKSNYVRYLKAMQSDNDYSGLERVIKHKKQLLKQANNDVKIAGMKVSDKNASKINSAVAEKVTYDSSGIIQKGAKEDYAKGLKKAKMSIGKNTIGNMASNYYSEPLKQGISSIKDTKFKDNKNLHKAIGRIGGTALLGGAVAGSVVADVRDDKELQRINNRLLSKYNAGEL